jgi:hypothetical protein
LLKKNKIYAIFFVAIVLMVVASPMYFTYRMLSHKNDTISNIEKNKETVTLKMSIDEYNEYKIEDKELSIHGKMFDIQSKNINGNEVEVVGFFDGKEDKLIDSLKHSYQKNNTKQTITFFSFFYFEKIATFKAINFMPAFIIHKCSYKFSIPIGFQNTEIQPPNFI